MGTQQVFEEVDATVGEVSNGYRPMLKMADSLCSKYSTQELLEIAQELYCSEKHQVRMVAVFLFGKISAEIPETLTFLKETVSSDENWRVQEVLAMAFDQYCKDVSYEKALPVIQVWLATPVPNIRRAVTEGLRIWTLRPYFSKNPQVAIDFLIPFRGADSVYLRKSVGNALRDISKTYPELVKQEISSWDLGDKKTLFTYKLVIKNGLLEK